MGEYTCPDAGERARSVTSDRDDHSYRLVTKHCRCLAGRVPVHEVSAAHAARRQLDDDLAWTRLWIGHIFDAHVVRRVVHTGAHQPLLAWRTCSGRPSA